MPFIESLTQSICVSLAKSTGASNQAFLAAALKEIIKMFAGLPV